MSAWPARLLVLGGALFLAGWCLVLASGHGGNSVGGSEFAWQAGGVMLYGSIPALLVAAGWWLALRTRIAARSRSR